MCDEREVGDHYPPAARELRQEHGGRGGPEQTAGLKRGMEGYVRHTFEWLSGDDT